MTSINLTPKLRAMLERIERQSGTLLVVQITANGRTEENKLAKLIDAGFAVKQLHPTVKDSFWDRNAMALAITEAGRAALLGKTVAKTVATSSYLNRPPRSLADLERKESES